MRIRRCRIHYLRALSRDEVFVTGIDVVMTDSMKYCDVVLPAASHFEFDDVYAAADTFDDVLASSNRAHERRVVRGTKKCVLAYKSTQVQRSQSAFWLISSAVTD